jgi:hypothetical protein
MPARAFVAYMNQAFENISYSFIISYGHFLPKTGNSLQSVNINIESLAQIN